MKASEAQLIDLLGTGLQFVIPIYQRTYSWTTDDCLQLWEDILRAGKNDNIDAHFTGSIVYVERGLGNLTRNVPNLLIDGQQRVTTVTLLLIALAGHLATLPPGDQEPLDGFTPQEIRDRFLVNANKTDDRRHKLLLSQTDKTTLTAIVDGVEPIAPVSERVVANYQFFKTRVSAPGLDLAAVCAGVSKLVVVDIRLDRSHDNPQLIFESMNSTGRKLSQADLIRNYVLMGLEPHDQERYYGMYWRPMELDFGQAAYDKQFDDFVRHYLTVVTRSIPRLGDIYDAFKVYASQQAEAGRSVEDLLNELRRYSKRYCAIALGHEQDKTLARAFQDLREIKADVVYPFLLEVYSDRDAGTITTAQMAEIVDMVIAYVFRRAVCHIPPNSLNTTFATFSRAVRKERYLDSVKAHLLALKSYKRMPTDEEFVADLKTLDLYSFQRRSYFLRQMENHGRKEHVAVESYTIEHILPQNENLSAAWREALGDDWQTIQATYLHTLGNLTLTGYNSEYSDHPFAKKRDMEGGFHDSPLRLNKGLGQLEQWTAKEIEERADRLAAEAVSIWRRPELSPEMLDEFASPAPPLVTFTLDDHPSLLPEPRHTLFETFRSTVLDWDPSVTEFFTKHYVAYKADTNFVDVVTQKARLLLSLNIPFESLHDERQIAMDVSNVGHLGNGDTEVSLDEQSDFTYVMGLVRQAYELQIGE